MDCLVLLAAFLRFAVLVMFLSLPYSVMRCSTSLSPVHGSSAGFQGQHSLVQFGSQSSVFSIRSGVLKQVTDLNEPSGFQWALRVMPFGLRPHFPRMDEGVTLRSIPSTWAVEFGSLYRVALGMKVGELEAVHLEMLENCKLLLLSL